MPKTSDNAQSPTLAEYLFPVALEDAIPLDLTEALPLPDVEYIGMGDYVTYEYVNEWGAVERRFSGKVIDVDYTTNCALVDSPTEYRPYWCAVEYLSLNLNETADTAATAAVPAA